MIPILCRKNQGHMLSEETARVNNIFMDFLFSLGIILNNIHISRKATLLKKGLNIS